MIYPVSEQEILQMQAHRARVIEGVAQGLREAYEHQEKCANELMRSPLDSRILMLKSKTNI